MQQSHLAYVPLLDIRIRYLASSEPLAINLVQDLLGTSMPQDLITNPPEIVIVSVSDDHTQDSIAEVTVQVVVV